MATVDYCPKCDIIVPQISNKCYKCQSRTISLYYNIKEKPTILIFFVFLALIILFMAYGIIGSLFIRLLFGIILLLGMVVGFTYFIYYEQKPEQDAVVERGRLLYKKNKDKYENGDDIEDTETPPPAQFSWTLRNVDNLRIAFVISVLLVPIPLALQFIMLQTSEPRDTVLVWILTMLVISIAMGLHIIYRPARKHSEIIRVLKLKPEEVEMQFKSLIVRSND